MLCERCKKNPANTLIRENVNGVLKEMHLCSSCAKEAGYHDLFSIFWTAFLRMNSKAF